MKRILMLCLLLALALANVGAAQADSFAFGPKGFDDKASLLDNLNSLKPAGKFQDAWGVNVLDMDNMYVSLIAVSNTAVESGVQVFFNGPSSTAEIGNAAALAGGSWPPAQPVGDVNDIYVGWVQDNEFKSASYEEMADPGLSGYFDYYQIVGAYYYGEELVYTPDGGTPITFVGDTYFIGISINQSNTVDFIMAISPAPYNAVPVPAAVWLMGTGLAGLVALRKRNK